MPKLCEAQPMPRAGKRKSMKIGRAKEPKKCPVQGEIDDKSARRAAAGGAVGLSCELAPAAGILKGMHPGSALSGIVRENAVKRIMSFEASGLWPRSTQ